MSDEQLSKSGIPLWLQGAIAGAFIAAMLSLILQLLINPGAGAQSKTAVALPLVAGAFGGIVGSFRGWGGILITVVIFWVLVVCSQIIFLLWAAFSAG